MKTLKPILCFITIICMSGSAQAEQQAPFVGMRHLKPHPAPNVPVAPDEKVDDHVNNLAPQQPAYTPLSPKDALIEPDDLEKWDHMSEAALATSKDDIKRLIHLIESDRGAVPPQGLFLAAKSLADKGMMQQAAVYFFAGQLRLSFDMARWPVTQNKEDVKRLAEDSKKSADQSAPNRNRDPRMDNPHQGVKNLGDQIGQPIMSWVLKSPERMESTIGYVREWDISSPYAYLPDYELTEPVPFKQWEKLLSKTRDNYFSQIASWSKVMSKVRM